MAELNEQDKVLKVVEKPLIPKSNMAMVGVYYIKETEVLFKALDKHLNDRNTDEEGEYHLTNALQFMIEEGITFHGFRVNNWFDCGKKENLLYTNAVLLKEQSERRGETTTSYQYDTSVIIPPVSIAEGCTISHSIIGPNVTIGAHTKIRS